MSSHWPPPSSIMSDPLHGSPAADLLQDLLLLVFLLLPSDPQNLLAVSLVCKRWRRLVRNPAFLRLFRAHHRPPPVLGFFQNLRCSDQHQRRLGFVPTAPLVLRRTTPDPDMTRWALDCRHGRVLLHGHCDEGLHVWDPLAGEDRCLSMPRGWQGSDIAAAALICAAGHDDHTDCRSTPFQIVFLDVYCKRPEQVLSASVYSSETGTWGDATVIPFPAPYTIDSSKRGTLVGDSVYWVLEIDDWSIRYILEFSLSSHRLELIQLPGEDVIEKYSDDIHVIPAADGGIGFCGVNRYSLHFWSRRIDPQGAAEWARIRIIDLSKLFGLPDRHSLFYSSVVAFAEDNDELFIQSGSFIFMLNIKSLRLKKVLQTKQRRSPIYPYTSLYTRGRDIAGIDDREDQ